MAWNQGYSDQENSQWSMLRAIEWGILPAFLSQSIVPVLLMFFGWWEVIGAFIILTILWSFVRYRFVNVAMARFVVFFVLLKWITIPTAVIYLLIQQNYISAVVALLWPIFLAPYLGIFIGGTDIGKIQEMFMAQLGYSKKQLPKSGVNDDTHQGVPRDYVQAEAWFKEGKEHWLQFRAAEAAACFKPAAERGHAEAQYLLSCLYRFGRGVPQDDIQAVEWCRKAAEQGILGAQCSLAEMYAEGQSVPKDYTQSAFWYRKAAEQGNADAQFKLGRLYKKGHGVPQDDIQSAFWYRKAAEQGNAEAQYLQGMIYALGDDIPHDDAKAAFWYRKAAEQGIAGAQFKLGLSYKDGRGVPQDDAQAAFWYRKAAEQGYAEAQFLLGLSYYLGLGLSQDYTEAYFLLDLAIAGNLSASNMEQAAKFRMKIASHLTPIELARVEVRAQKWSEAHKAKPQ
jgi:TPR repeat protein